MCGLIPAGSVRGPNCGPRELRRDQNSFISSVPSQLLSNRFVVDVKTLGQNILRCSHQGSRTFPGTVPITGSVSIGGSVVIMTLPSAPQRAHPAEPNEAFPVARNSDPQNS